MKNAIRRIQESAFVKRAKRLADILTWGIPFLLATWAPLRLAVYPALKSLIHGKITGIEFLQNQIYSLLIICATACIAAGLIIFKKTHFFYPAPSGIRLLLLLSLFCSYCSLPAQYHLGIDYTITVLYTMGAFYVCYGLMRHWSVALFSLLFIPAFLQGAIRFRYDVDFDAHLLSEIIGASPQDAIRFITPGNCGILLSIILGSIVLIAAIPYTLKRESRKKAISFGTLCVLLSAALSVTFGKPLWEPIGNRSHAPEGFLIRLNKGIQIAQLSQEQILHMAKAVPSPSLQPSSVKPEALAKGTICMLHIGESVRNDHLSISGYHRPTTPFLESVPNLIHYQDCTAVAPFTTAATFALLTDAKANMEIIGVDDALKPTCGCVIDLFHANNFKCYAYIPKQFNNNTFGALYERLGDTLFFTAMDKREEMRGDSLSQMQQIKDEDFTDSQQNYFLFINNLGSHHPYCEYNQTNPPFTPASPNAYNQSPARNPEIAQMVINTYDNTIRYWDDSIKELLSGMEGKPYIYIYISDHGEYMGENGVWARNGDFNTFFTTPACNVPFFVIYSPEFEQQNPHFKEALARLREHADMSIGQEHIFHTLIGIFGIQTPYYDEELDLTSDKVKPYTGPHPSRNGKSADGKKWY